MPDCVFGLLQFILLLDFVGWQCTLAMLVLPSKLAAFQPHVKT